MNNVVIRKAIDVAYKNEIANFSGFYFTPVKGISAVSIECLSGFASYDNRYRLLQFVCEKFGSNKIKFMLYLPDQPCNRITKYKGGWELLKNKFIDFSKIENKSEVSLEIEGKLNFILEGYVDLIEKDIIKNLFSISNAIYFSSEMKSTNFKNVRAYSDWVNLELSKDAYVFFFLDVGSNLESEIVILKNSTELFKVFEAESVDLYLRNSFCG